MLEKYVERPWEWYTVDRMNDGIIERYNDLVDDGDDVFMPGDFAMGNICESLELVKRLHGRKHFLAGNHDKCWAGHGKKHLRWIDAYFDAGFATVHSGAVPIHLTLSDGTRVVCSHFPYKGDKTGKDRFPEWRPKDEGLVELHGHVHELWRVNGRMINVGVDVHDWFPVPEVGILELVRGIV